MLNSENFKFLVEFPKNVPDIVDLSPGRFAWRGQSWLWSSTRGESAGPRRSIEREMGGKRAVIWLKQY